MIKNSLLEGLTILRFSIERLKERERLLVLLSTVCGLLLLWYLLSYIPQSNALHRTKASTNDVVQLTATLAQKRTMIEGLVKDNSVSKLMARYAYVQQEMKELERTMARYETRYIDFQHLNSLLYSILQQTTDVSIVTFSNTSTITTEQTESPLESGGAPAMQPATSTPTEAAGTATPPPSSMGPKIERYQYKLTLKGSYPSIVKYLNKLEGTGWQFYWDKMIYVVQEYPDALVTIEFYTLRPAPSDESSVQGGKA